MDNSYKEEVGRAEQEFFEVLDTYRKLANECVSVFGPGETNFKLKFFPSEKLGELKEARVKTTEAHKKWHNLILSYTEAKR